MIKLITIVILIFLSFIALANNKSQYTIGVEDIDYYPQYAFTHKKSSFIKELLETFFTQEKISIKFVPLPLKRFNQWYSKDKIDFKYPDNKIWRVGDTNSLDITYSESVVKLMAGTVILAKNKHFKVDDIKRLGTIAGFYSALWIDRIKTGKTQQIEDGNVLSVVKLATHGMVDAINLDYSVINFQLEQLKQKKTLIMSKSLPHKEVSFHLSTIKHTQILKRFDEFLNNNPLYIKQLKDKYGLIEDPFDLSSF